MKWRLFTYISSTIVFVTLLGQINWHGTDIEYRYYTAVRMHACDIFKNNQSTLRVFNPDKCSVSRHQLFIGQMIDGKR
jgi:hypothetical protein